MRVFGLVDSPAPSPNPNDSRLASSSLDQGFAHWFRRVITFDRLEVVSLIHSTIYFALLISAFVFDGPQPYTFIFGLSHGLIWIGMSILSVLAVRYRVINLPLAVAIAVLGCVAPFFGSAEFLRQKHQMKAAER